MVTFTALIYRIFRTSQTIGHSQNRRIAVTSPTIFMFCSLCQQTFKAAKAYHEHLGRKKHLEYKAEFDSNPSKFRNKITKHFLEDFIRFVSRLSEPLEIQVAYQRYMTGNKYRISGSNFRKIEECLPNLKNRIKIEEETEHIIVSGFTY